MRLWHIAHREEVLARQRKWRAANPKRILELRRMRKPHPPEKVRQWNAAYYAKNTEKVREQARKWAAANPERKRATDHKRYETHPEKMHERCHRWRQSHPVTCKNYATRRRARKLGNGGFHTAAEWLALCWASAWRCFYCAAPLNEKTAVQEHKVPLARGGSDDISNLALSCVGCNSRKHTMTDIEFLSRRAGKS